MVEAVSSIPSTIIIIIIIIIIIKYMATYSHKERSWKDSH
jgi:hypothetical protein